jgi:hypothetical protein
MTILNLNSSEALVRRAIRAYWIRQVGPVFPAVAIVLTGYVVYRFAIGDRSWVVGVMATTVLLSFLLMAATYVVHLRRSLERLRRMGAPEATLELGEDRFRISSGSGSSEIEWSLIRQVWRFEGVWILFFSASEFMLLPTTALPSEARELILAKAKGAGARIA